jgi:putative ABC transport system permease protein
LGDDLELIVPENIAKLKVVGLLENEGVALLNNGAVAYAPLDVVQDLFYRRGNLDEIALKIVPEIANDVDALDQFKEQFNTIVGKNARVEYPSARGQLVARMLDTYQLGLSFFSVIAIFVGMFLIYNTFSMTMAERARETGLLRAIGMTRGQVIFLVLTEAVLLSLAGSVLGLGLGILLARGMMYIMGGFLGTAEDILNIPASGLLQSISIGIVVTIMAAVLPAFQAARISPLEALRARVKIAQRARPIMWISGIVIFIFGLLVIYEIEVREEVWFIVGSGSVLMIMLGAILTVPIGIRIIEPLTRLASNRIYGTPGRIGTGNIQRTVARTTLTVAALIVSLTMIVGIGALTVSIEDDMTSWIDAALGGDLYISSPIRMRDSFANQLFAIHGVEAVTPGSTFTVRIAARSLPEGAKNDDNISFMAIDPQTYRQITSIEFVEDQGDPEENWARFFQGDAIFVSSVAAERYQIEQGDSLYLMTRRGERPFYVAGIIVEFFGLGGRITGSFRDAQTFFAENGVQRFTIKVAEGYEIVAVSKKIEDRFQDRKHISVISTQSFKQGILDMVGTSLKLFDVLSMIGIVIGSLGVINTLTMNVLERRREIGGLRALGMTKQQVILMVLAEAFGIGVMGAIYGLMFGHLLAILLVNELNSANGYDLVFVPTLRPYLFGLIVALIVSQIAALSPAQRAASMNIVEAVGHE